MNSVSFPPFLANTSVLNKLDAWTNDATVTGKKLEAARRIRTAISTNATQLDLVMLELSSLPPLDELHHRLQSLDVSNNNLTALPSDIGNLTSLRELYVSNNDLTALPSGIGNLTSLRELYVSDNNLTALPPDIGNLTSLQSLNVAHNKLTELPSEISNLTSLLSLDVSYNKLTELPSGIGNLTSLQSLGVSVNKLTKLPSGISNLTFLEELWIVNNNLTALPPGISNLISLRELHVSGNNLTALPPDIDNMTLLTSLVISNNPNLRELPCSLGNCRRLTLLYISQTQIRQELRDAILARTESLRSEEAQSFLPHVLRVWQMAAGLAPDPTLLSAFDASQQKILYEWLIRLEKTKDFRGYQQALAQAVCGVLLTASHNLDFKEGCLSQMRANNTDCEDRASMAMNELYTLWRLATLPQEALLSQKLAVLISGAKTIALRNTLTAIIVAHEQEQGHEEQEATEIFLYYEILLKDSLGLLSLISEMSYGMIGERSWIDLAALTQSVETTYENCLFDLPAFDLLIRQDPTYETSLQQLHDTMQTELERAELDKAQKEGTLVTQCNTFRETYKREVHELKKSWMAKISL